MSTTKRKMFYVHWSSMECFCAYQVLALDEAGALRAFDRACARYYAQGKGNAEKYDHKDVVVTCWDDKPHMHKHWKWPGHFVYAGPYRYSY